MPPLTFEVATAADDAGLRRLLRENPMPGSISVTFECEPSYFRAAAVEGFHQTVAVKEKDTGDIVGMGSRSVRPVFLNGVVQSVGYLSQLRARPSYWRGLALARTLARAFERTRALHADGRTPFYLLSVIADNEPARRLLTSGVPGFPHIQPYTRLHTYAVYLARPRPPLPLPAGLRLERGSPEYVPAILDCLQRNGAHRQFAPYWSAETLFNSDWTPDLKPENFFLALDGTRVAGCVALWDQSRFKQTIVRGYSGMMGRWRRLINLLAPLGGWPVLPAPNTPWRYGYASHLAVDDDEPRIFAALLRALYNHAQRAGRDYFLLGLSDANPFCSLVTKAYGHITYTSQLYLVAWDDGLEAVSKVDGRVPGPEIAVL